MEVDTQSRAAAFLEYSPQIKALEVGDSNASKIVISKDVKLYEGQPGM